MNLRDFFVRLGLDVDTAKFAGGMATVEALKEGLHVVAELAERAKEFLEEQVRATAEAGTEAKRMSNILGITAQDYQRLAYAANVSEVNTDALTAATRKLAMRGIKDTTGYLIQMADRLHALPEGSQRATIALQEFGRSGRELLPLLNKGGAEIRRLMGEADELGIVMSGKDLEATEEYAEAQKRLGFGLQGLRNTIVLPLLKGMADAAMKTLALVKSFHAWYVETHDRLTGALKALGIILAAVGVALLINAANAAIASTAAWGLGTALIAAGRAGVVAAWEFLTAWVTAAAPVILIAAILAGVYLILNDLVVFMNGGDSLIGKGLKKWIGPFEDWRDAVKKIIAEVKKDLLDAIPHWKSKEERAAEHGASWNKDNAFQEKLKGFAPWLFGSGNMTTAGAGIVGAGIGGGAASPGAAAANFTPFNPNAISSQPGGAPSVQEVHHYHHHETTLKVEVGDHGVKRLIHSHDEQANREAEAATGE